MGVSPLSMTSRKRKAVIGGGVLDKAGDCHRGSLAVFSLVSSACHHADHSRLRHDPKGD